MSLPKAPAGYTWDIQKSPLGARFNQYSVLDNSGESIFEFYIDQYHKHPILYNIEIRGLFRTLKKIQREKQSWKGQGMFT